MSQVERLVSDRPKDAGVSHGSHNPLEHLMGCFGCLVAFILIFLPHLLNSLGKLRDLDKAQDNSLIDSLLLLLLYISKVEELALCSTVKDCMYLWWLFMVVNSTALELTKT